MCSKFSQICYFVTHVQATPKDKSAHLLIRGKVDEVCCALFILAYNIVLGW